MPKRAHRAQKTDVIGPDDLHPPVVVRPLPDVDDRLHNPRDIEVDQAAIRAGTEHGGMQETRAQALSERGTGGRKRSGPFGRHQTGRDLTKRR
jgi:hypothetical protein